MEAVTCFPHAIPLVPTAVAANVIQATKVPTESHARPLTPARATRTLVHVELRATTQALPLLNARATMDILEMVSHAT
jgi:hypothetical protein